MYSKLNGTKMTEACSPPWGWVVKKRICFVSPETLWWATVGIPGALILLEGSLYTGAPLWRAWAQAGASLACARRSKLCVEPQDARGTLNTDNNMHAFNFHRE